MPSSDVVLSVTEDAFLRAQSVKNAFGDWAPPGPAGGASVLLQTPQLQSGEGPTSKGKGRKESGRNREGKGKGYGRRKEKGRQGDGDCLLFI